MASASVPPLLSSSVLDDDETSGLEGDDILDELLNLDANELFGDIVLTLDNILDPAEQRTTPELTLTLSSVPNPLAHITNYEQETQFVPISPTPSTTDLENSATTTIQVPVEDVPSPLARVSPTPSTPTSPEPATKKRKTAVPAKKASPKKRQRSAFSSDKKSESKPATTPSTIGDTGKKARIATDTTNVLTPEEEVQLELERRTRNREHARRSRLRKKSLTKHLEQSLTELKAENAKLRNVIYGRFGREQTESMVYARTASNEEKFLLAFQKPSNRIMDETTIEFLKSLSAKVAKEILPVEDP